MPPGLTANLHGDHLLPGGGDRRGGADPGQSRAGQSELPGDLARSAPPTSPPAPAPTPSTRSARSTWPGPSRARRSRLVAITPALAGPYDYGTVVVRVALHIDPLDAHVIADSETVPADHRRHPDPDALDPGQHRQAELHDQPDQLLAPSRSPRRGSATRARSPTSPPTSTRSTARPCPSSPEDDDHPARRPQEHQRAAKDPSLHFDLNTRPGDANIKSIAVTLPNAFEIDQRHLGNLCAEVRTRNDPVRRAASRSARSTTKRRCSKRPSKAPPTRSPATAACPTSPSSSAAR